MSFKSNNNNIFSSITMYHIYTVKLMAYILLAVAIVFCQSVVFFAYVHLMFARI